MNSYVGNSPTTGHFPTDTFTSSGGSTYTLSKAPATTGSIEVSVQGVLQAVSAYSISGTTLTLAGVTSGDVIFVRHLGETLLVPVPVDDSVTTAKIADGAITAAKIADGTVVAAEIASNAVTTVKIIDDAVTGAKIADNACNSEHYTDGSIDTAHIADLQVTTAKLAADAITAAKIADDVINSEHYAAASIDNEHLADDAVGIAELSATGTASNTTFLRGDNAWVAIPDEVTKSSSDPTISTNPSGGVGTIFLNTTSGEMFACTNAATGSNVWTNIGDGTGNIDASFAALGGRGIFAGGYAASGGANNTIDYITIATTGNATNFGDINWNDQGGMDGVSNGSRGCFAGGYQGGVGYVNFIDYITIASPGNASDFGDLTYPGGSGTGCSNGPRGVFGGYFRNGADNNTLDYITIATTGNATDFGNLTTNRGDASALANDTRGIWAGGETGNGGAVRVNTMDYVTIATTGNATDFGDCAGNRQAMIACSNNVRGLWGGGTGGSNEIKYVTIMTTGNVTDFGDLTASRGGLGGCSNGTRGVFGAFHSQNILDYVTIATTGNATDFGDLSVARSAAACSGD